MSTLREDPTERANADAAPDTKAEGEARTPIRVSAIDVASSFDLREARSILERDGGRMLEANPLLVQFDLRHMIAVFDYGAVVFFNYDRGECGMLLDRLKPAAVRENKSKSEDEYVLHTGPRLRKPEGTDELYVREFNRDIALVVGIVLSRSVSLEYYEKLVASALAQMEQTVNALASEGWLPRRVRESTKQVGFTLAVDLELAYNVAVLEDPDVIWNGGSRIGELYTALKREFDLEDRIKIIQQKISIIARSSTFILSRLEAQRASLLEWIIILLILSEIVLALVGRV